MNLLSFESLYILIQYLLISDYYPPPGTIKLSDSTYIDQVVKTNADWKEYVMSKKSTQTNFFLPDTSLMIGNKNYYFHPKFVDFPVLGLSDSVIIEYCKWRGEFITNNLKNYDIQNCCKNLFYVNNLGKNIEVKFRKAKESELIEAQKLGLLKQIDLSRKMNEKLFSKTFRCVATIIEK